MFDWLEREISEIKTPRFHLIDGPAPQILRESIIRSPMPVPASYKQFVLRFGNAKLYRNGRTSYTIGVFASPKETTLIDGARIWHLGFHSGASVYIKPECGLDKIFEFEDGVEEQTGKDFSRWLSATSHAARESYGAKKWAEIVRGPAPFTREEEDRIEARRQIEWKLLNLDSDGDYLFEISNNAQRSLPTLTVGVRSKDGRLNGAVRLDIRHIKPGQKAVLKVDCYKNLAPPEEIEVFSLPEPRPEDRDYYRELIS